MVFEKHWKRMFLVKYVTWVTQGIAIQMLLQTVIIYNKL